jgi:DNA-binding PadR family transcriptional regulator
MMSERQLTELEGAILTEIAMRGNDTAYKVRRAFQDSPSVQWRGSAGAVSPAIHRLTQGGLVATAPHGTRRGLRLSLTDRGEQALESWASDVELACGVGLDPFRLRAGVWEQLAKGPRDRVYLELARRLKAELKRLSARASSDAIDTRQTELAVILLEARLNYIKMAQDAPRNPQEKSS